VFRRPARYLSHRRVFFSGAGSFFKFWSKCLSYVFTPRPARALRPSAITSVSLMFSLWYSCLSLCCFVATFMTFFSVFDAITVLCGTINILLRLCVVPSVSVTFFPLASFTTCTSSLHRLSVPFLNSSLSSISDFIAGLQIGYKSIIECFKYI
jgi:hypothetical protein